VLGRCDRVLVLRDGALRREGADVGTLRAARRAAARRRSLLTGAALAGGIVD
jgi:hypothetical protein